MKPSWGPWKSGGAGGKLFLGPDSKRGPKNVVGSYLFQFPQGPRERRGMQGAHRTWAQSQRRWAGNFLGFQQMFAHIVRRPAFTFCVSLHSFIFCHLYKVLSNEEGKGLKRNSKASQNTLCTAWQNSSPRLWAQQCVHLFLQLHHTADSYTLCGALIVLVWSLRKYHCVQFPSNLPVLVCRPSHQDFFHVLLPNQVFPHLI